MATYAAYRHIELDNVGYGKKRVLKPPGGGSSDIFGAGHPGHNEHSGRKQVLAKNANQSQLSHGFFSESETDLAPAPQAQQAPATPVSQNGSTSSIGSGSAPDTPRSSKPGNDSYNRLFGPPDAPPPSTPNSNTYRSTISLNNVVATPPNDDNSSQVSLTGQQQLMQPPAGITSNTSTILVNPTGGVTATGSEYGSSTALNDHPATNWSAANNVVAAAHHNGNSINGTNGYHHNDVIDGNPVTGAGYDMQHNGGGSTGSSIAGSDKSSTDSSPSVAPVQRMKNRVPPGGFSSGLW